VGGLRDHHHVVLIVAHAADRRRFLQHAHDRVFHSPDPDLLVDGIQPGFREQPLVGGVAQHDHAAAVEHFGLGEEAPDLDFREPRLGELLGGADDRELLGPVAAVVHPLGGLRQPGAEQDVHGLDGGRQLLDRLGVVDRQVRTTQQIRELGAAPDADDAQFGEDDRVRTERLHAVAQRLVEAADERRHADDGGDADHHAEDGEAGAQLVPAQGVERHAHDFAG
jgi:hypothetical protein